MISLFLNAVYGAPMLSFTLLSTILLAPLMLVVCSTIANRSANPDRWLVNPYDEQNRHLALLNRASQAFNSTLDLDRVLATVLEETRQMLGVASCSAWLIDPQTNELVCRQCAGSRSEIVHGWRLAQGQGIAGWAVHHDESAVVPDVTADGRHFHGIEDQTGLGVRAILAVPLRIKGRVIGVLEMVDTKAGRFTQADLALAEPLAATAAGAIENARLYEQVVQEAEARLRHMSELIRLNVELQEALAEVRTLSGLLPICAHCKSIRDDQGYWHRVEVYIQEHSEAEFSHGICPECLQALYSDYTPERE